jgi:hypothetical protein
MRLKNFLRSFVLLFFIFSVNSADISNQEKENEKLRYLQKVQGTANILAGVTLFCDPLESAQFIAAEALFLLSADLFHLCAADLENEETKKKAISHFKSAALNASAAYSILYGTAEYYFTSDPKYIYFGSMLLVTAGVNTLLQS